MRVILIAGLFAACSKDPKGAAHDAFGPLRSALTGSGWTVDIADVSAVATVTNENRDQLAGQIIDHVAILVGSPGAVPMVQRDDAYIAAHRAELIASFEQAGLIRTDDVVIKVNWNVGAPPLETYGVTDSDGKPRFEPVLYFGQSPPVETAEIRAAAASDPFHHLVRHEFDSLLTPITGVACAIAEYDIAIQPDGCRIVDPAPHVQISACSTFCWFYKIDCNKGEQAFCGSSNCPAGNSQGCMSPNDPNCIKYAVQTVEADGFGSVIIDTGAEVSIGGIKLEGKLKMASAGGLGYTDKREYIASLCATGEYSSSCTLYQCTTNGTT